MKRKRMGNIILIIGLFLILYPIISDIFFSYNHSTVISNYEEKINNTSNEELQKIKEDLNKYNKELVDSEQGQVKTPGEEEIESTSYLNLLNLGDIIGYIEIPKINVNLPIYHGVNNNVLETGIGHMEKTSLPTGKPSSHCVLAGHTGLMKSRLFDDIDKLVIDDIFLITVLDETYAYKVDQIKVVEPEDTKDIEIVEGKEYVTLITCVPYGINSHRLLVRGTGIDEALLDELTSKNLDEKKQENSNTINEKLSQKLIANIANNKNVFHIIIAIINQIIVLVLLIIFMKKLVLNKKYK